MAEVPFRPARQLSEYKGKGASASREIKTESNKEKILEIAAIKYFIVLLFFLGRVKFLDWSSYLMKRS